MKELDLIKSLTERDKTEITQEKEQEYKLVFQERIIPHENHILFELNPSTLQIKKARYEKQDWIYNPKWTKKSKPNLDSKVIVEIGMIYISALNKSNALKKFKKESNGTKIDSTKTYLSL